MAALELLTPTVHAMHGEVQQLMQDRTRINDAVRRVEAAVTQIQAQQTQKGQAMQKFTTELTTAATVQAQQAQETNAAVQATLDIKGSGEEVTNQVRNLIQRITQLEQQGVGSSASAQGSKKK